MTTKSFNLSTILSLTTGRFVTDSFSDMHECAEHVAGHPIWTHEFADKALCTRLRESVFAQHPSLRGIDVSAVTDAETAAAFVREQVAIHGERLPIDKGATVRDESPIESLKRIRDRAPS